jgi:hypothetical protein
MAVAKSLQPDQWWIPLKSINEEKLVRENLEQFVYLALIRFGYGSPRSLKLEKREEDHGSWSAKFTAAIDSNIIKGEVTYLPASNSLILSISPRGGGA